MKALTKLLRRRPGFSAALVLLLALGVGFLSVSASILSAVLRQGEAVKGQYTTAAIPYNEEVSGWMPQVWYDTVEDGSGQYDLPALALDRRILLGAVIEGSSPCVFTRPENIVDADTESRFWEADSLYNMAVIAVRCQRIRSMSPYGGTPYECTFSVEKILCAVDRGWERPTQLFIYSDLVTEEREPPFEEGKTYLLRGSCGVVSAAVPGQAIFELEDGSADSGLRQESGDENGAGACSFEEEGSLPLYAEYEGPLEDFLSSEEGRVWTEEIIPAAERTYSSAKLILTDQVSGIYQFGREQAAIMTGRAISREEYAAGAAVCLVSQEYAEKNKLSVGDRISMELYHLPSLFRTRLTVDEEGNYHGLADQSYLAVNPCLPEYSLGIEQEYTVVGIYTGEAVYYGTFPFSPDMIFAPKASLPEAAAYEGDFYGVPGMNSVLLENGTIEKFEAEMERRGYPGSFLYSDQGYTEMARSLNAAAESAERLLAVGGTVFLLAAGVCLFLLTGRFSPVMRGMRIMGETEGACRRAAMEAALPLLLCAAALGASLGGAAFRRVSGLVASQTLEFDLSAALWCAGGQFLLLVLCCFGCFSLAARQDLMQRGGRKRRHRGAEP